MRNRLAKEKKTKQKEEASNCSIENLPLSHGHETRIVYIVHRILDILDTPQLRKAITVHPSHRHPYEDHYPLHDAYTTLLTQPHYLLFSKKGKQEGKGNGWGMPRLFLSPNLLQVKPPDKGTYRMQATF